MENEEIIKRLEEVLNKLEAVVAKQEAIEAVTRKIAEAVGDLIDIWSETDADAAARWRLLQAERVINDFKQVKDN